MEYDIDIGAVANLATAKNVLKEMIKNTAEDETLQTSGSEFLSLV